MFNLPFAGMPAPLPLDIPFRREATGVEMRLQAISFFLLVILLCALVVWKLWNYLGRDVSWMPRISFGKALVGVLLWGLAAFIVLTMISGARELMTPGAWKKDGLTYKLADDPSVVDESADARKRHMERLRTALWHFAAKYDGRFPDDSEKKEISEELWSVPDGGGLRYHYVVSKKANDASELLVIEPEIQPGRRFTLLTNGEIVVKTSEEIKSMAANGGK